MITKYESNEGLSEGWWIWCECGRSMFYGSNILRPSHWDNKCYTCEREMFKIPDYTIVLDDCMDVETLLKASLNENAH